MYIDGGYIKKNVFFFFFYVSLNEGTNPRKFIHAVCPFFPFFPPFSSFFQQFLFFFFFFFFFFRRKKTSSPAMETPDGDKLETETSYTCWSVLTYYTCYMYKLIVIFILYRRPRSLFIMYMLVHTGRYTRILLQRGKLSWEICFLAFFYVRSYLYLYIDMCVC